MGSLAVSQNGNLIYQNTIGFKNIENSVESDDNTKYRIGSVSKIFTAALILKAIEEKKLKLNQTIETFFPNVKNADKITIENLLNHSSGIQDFARDQSYFKWNTIKHSKADMLERISNYDSVFASGSKSEYSNSNYVLLTFILKDIYGQPFSEILKNNIIKPLNLKNTYYGGEIDVQNNEAKSFKFLGKWKEEPETDMSIPQGAGAIVSNVTDLNIFIQQLFSGNIVSDKSLGLMKTIKNDYGLGMFQFSYLDELNYGHTGGIDGFQSVAVYFPNTELAISITSNAVNYPLKEILIPVFNIYHKKPIELPEFFQMKLSSEELDKYLGTYASKEIPPKITVSKEGNTLLAQVTGQTVFPLEATSKNNFIFKQAGVKIEFKPNSKVMILKQGGKEFLFYQE